MPQDLCITQRLNLAGRLLRKQEMQEMKNEIEKLEREQDRKMNGKPRMILDQ